MSDLQARLAEIQERVEKAQSEIFDYTLPNGALVTRLPGKSQWQPVLDDHPFLLQALTEALGALERWKCGQCSGRGGWTQDNIPSDTTKADLVFLQCPACDGTGKAWLARQAITRISQMGVEP